MGRETLNTNYEKFADYIERHSKKIAARTDNAIPEHNAPQENTATFNYQDEKAITFSVKGYNLVYLNSDGNLMHVFLEPSSIGNLSNADKLHEREELERKLEELGYKLDDSEDFRKIIVQSLESR